MLLHTLLELLKSLLAKPQCTTVDYVHFCLQALSLEEARARQERLAKMRHLLFYSELKAKRLSKIKSKAFHRQANKAAKRKAARLGELGGDEAEKEAAEEAEFERAKVGEHSGHVNLMLACCCRSSVLEHCVCQLKCTFRKWSLCT